MAMVEVLKNPALAGIHRNLGIIFFQKNKNFDKAILHFQESIRLAPNQPEVEQIQSLIEALKHQSQKWAARWQIMAVFHNKGQQG